MVGTAPAIKMLFMLPVNAGYIKYSDLSNGSLTMFDIFIMNDFINYKSDYEEAISELASKE